MPSTNNLAAQARRDRPIRLVAEKGRMGWQQAAGYGRRNLVETVISCYKHLIGPKLRAHTLPSQQSEAVLAVTATQSHDQDRQVRFCASNLINC